MRAPSTRARYQDLLASEMPFIDVGGAHITVYSGSSHGVDANTLNYLPFTLVEIELDAGASVVQDLPGS